VGWPGLAPSNLDILRTSARQGKGLCRACRQRPDQIIKPVPGVLDHLMTLHRSNVDISPRPAARAPGEYRFSSGYSLEYRDFRRWRAQLAHPVQSGSATLSRNRP